MFSKHDATMALSHACLKYLALLEPQLVVQSVLDRAYPSLTGLEEVSSRLCFVHADTAKNGS